MGKIMPKKIHIIGSVGSGKTTLARRISNWLQLPHYEVDNIVWQRMQTQAGKVSIRRVEAERNQCLKGIVHSDAWILEGTHYTWIVRSFEQADLIIFIDTPYTIRTWRIVK